MLEHPSRSISGARAAAGVAAALLISGCVLVGGAADAGDTLDARFWLTWETVDSMNERIDCAFAGADTVRVTAWNTSTNDALVDLFDCHDGHGTTYPVTAGDYWVDVELVACDDDDMCADPIVVSGTAAVGPYEVFRRGPVDLGHFVFVLDDYRP